MSTLISDPETIIEQPAADVIDELRYRNYKYNRLALGLSAELFARHSEDGERFEARLRREQNGGSEIINGRK